MRMSRGWFQLSKRRPCLRSILPKSSVVRFFFCAKGLYAKDIHKEMFPAYGGKCLSRYAVPPWWQTFRWRRRGWIGGAETAETTVKRLEFRRTGKAMGRSLSMLAMSINNFFLVLISCVLRFVSNYDLFTDYPSYTQTGGGWRLRCTHARLKRHAQRTQICNTRALWYGAISTR
jgi:hypothetical protein